MTRVRPYTLALLMAAVAAPAWAQGHRGVPPGQAKKTKAPAPATPGAPSGGEGSTQAPPAGTSGLLPAREIGFWLDDASLVARGSVWLTLSTTRWMTPAASGYDLPLADATAGLGRRVHVTASMQYSRFSDTQGYGSGGLGDVYLGAKVVLREPDDRRTGIAVSPTLEIVSAATTAGDRLHWILPASVEHRVGSTRLYGSGGYATRGAWFGSGALERRLNDRLVLTAAVLQSWSRLDPAGASALEVSRRRTDVTGTAAWVVSPALVVFGGVGRTISRLDYDGARLALHAGISANLTTSSPARPPRR